MQQTPTSQAPAPQAQVAPQQLSRCDVLRAAGKPLPPECGGREVAPAPPPAPVYTGKLIGVGHGVFCPDIIAAAPPQFWGHDGHIGSLPYRGTHAGALAAFALPQYLVPREVIKGLEAKVAANDFKESTLLPTVRLCLQMYSSKEEAGKPDVHYVWRNIHSRWSTGKDARPHLKVKYVSFVSGAHKWVLLYPPKGASGAPLTEIGCDNDSLFAMAANDSRYP